MIKRVLSILAKPSFALAGKGLNRKGEILERISAHIEAALGAVRLLTKVILAKPAKSVNCYKIFFKRRIKCAFLFAVNNSENLLRRLF